MYGFRGGFSGIDVRGKGPFRTQFSFENATDCGGPMRDTISDICTELMSDMLPFMRPTANN